MYHKLSMVSYQLTVRYLMEMGTKVGQKILLTLLKCNFKVIIVQSFYMTQAEIGRVIVKNMSCNTPAFKMPL